MDFEAFILDALENIGQFDFNYAIRLLIFAIGVVWIFTTYWVWKDSEERIESVLVRILIVLLVLPLNFIALIAYLLSRPKDTFESAYWSDLEKRYLQYETTDMGDCENCGFDLQPGFQYCPVCSHPVKSQCPGCGEMINKYWNYCPFCRTQQREFMEEISKKSNRQIDKRRDLEIDVIEAHENERIAKIQEQVKQSPISEDKPFEVNETVEETGPEVTNEPQPEFGLDDVDKRPEVQKTRPEKTLFTIGKPFRVEERKTEDSERSESKPSIATELGKIVLTNVRNFGKSINDLFLGVVEKVKEFSVFEIVDERVQQSEDSRDPVVSEIAEPDESKERTEQEKKEMDRGQPKAKPAEEHEEKVDTVDIKKAQKTVQKDKDSKMDELRDKVNKYDDEGSANQKEKSKANANNEQTKITKSNDKEAHINKEANKKASSQKQASNVKDDRNQNNKQNHKKKKRKKKRKKRR